MLEPNRNYVIEQDGSIHKMLFCENADWEEKATTSIQEIRNKAITEFAERLSMVCESNATCVDRESGRPLYAQNGVWHDLINEIAEEILKRKN